MLRRRQVDVPLGVVGHRYDGIGDHAIEGEGDFARRFAVHLCGVCFRWVLQVREQKPLLVWVGLLSQDKR